MTNRKNEHGGSSHPENPEWMNVLAEEVSSARMGRIRCRACGEMVGINGAFMDVLVMRGISSIEKCARCQSKKLID